MATSPEEFAHADRGYVEAPAGHGKTELIVDSLRHLEGTRQLILTHTHAGVHALRERMVKKGIPRSGHRLETIASFALRWAVSYPMTSGLDNPYPVDAEWRDVYPAATRVLNVGSLLEVVGAIYDGLIVDEYQDCSRGQHRLISTLARVLPTRIVGDPLQGILGFDKVDPLVSQTEILEEFSEMEPLDTPHRWRRTNPKLGEWLQEARRQLEQGKALDWPKDIVAVRESNPADVVPALKGYGGADGSVVVLRKMETMQHRLAKQTGALYTSMEKLECPDLFMHAAAIQQSRGPQRAKALIDFVETCMANTNTVVGKAKEAYSKGQIARITHGKRAEASKMLNQVATTASLDPIWPAMETVRTLAESRPYRGELYWEMRRSLECAIHCELPLEDAARQVRDRTRRLGRPLPRRLVSRTHLIKGLEFDHVVVLDLDGLDKENTYVAITRPSTSLTVFK